MFAKLLSVMSVRAVLRPEQFFLHYDERPNEALEWQCACKLATCVEVAPRTKARPTALAHAPAHEKREVQRHARSADAHARIPRARRAVGTHT